MERLQLNDRELALLRTLTERFANHRRNRLDAKKNELPLLHEKEYERLFTPSEREALEIFLTIDPADFGITSERIEGADTVPDGLMRITGQYYRITPDAKKTTLMGPRYLPKETWVAFEQLRSAMERDIGRRVLVASGYRTPRHQLLLFVKQYLAEDRNIESALRLVGLPGMSQHGDPKHCAIDLLTQDGVYNESFADTEEYAWLKAHAAEYGFTESFPKGNSLGMAYEPWHWRWTG